MKKLTEKEVRDYLKEHGGWNLLSTYDGIHDSIVIEKDGYKTTTCLASFRNNDNAIKKQGTIFMADSKVIVDGKLKSVADMTEEEFEQKLREKWGRNFIG